MSCADDYPKKSKFKTPKPVVDDKDKKRILSKKDKRQVWENAKKDLRFDTKMFRIDIAGCLVMNNLVYNKNKNHLQKMLAVEYEHYVSHSRGGPTTIENTVLLGAQNNRKKGSRPLYEFLETEYAYLQYRNGISANRLYEDLERNPSQVCTDYGLYFVKVKGTFWTVEEYCYSRQYKNFNNIKIKGEGHAVAMAVGIALVGGAGFVAGAAASMLITETVIEPTINKVKSCFVTTQDVVTKEESDKMKKEDLPGQEEYKKKKECVYSFVGIASAICTLAYFIVKHGK